MTSLQEFVTQPTLFMILVGIWLVIFIWAINKVFETIIRSAIARTKTTLDDEIVPVLKNIILVGMCVSGLFVVTLYMDLEPEIHVTIENTYVSLILLLVSLLLTKIFHAILVSLSKRSYAHNDKYLHSAVPFLSNVISIVLFSVAGLIILKIFGINITPALASAGFVGVALAFAAKDFVGNLFGGVSVFFDRPYTVGDYVIIQDQYRGEVVEIGMRSTKIRTRDNILLTVPNAVMVTNTIINETGFEPQLRVRIPLMVTYGDDLDKIEKNLIAMVSEHDGIMRKPEPSVRFREFSESGISLEILVVIKEPAERGRIKHELIKMVNAGLRKKGISVPYPRREIFMHK